MEMFSTILPVLLVLSLAATHVESDCTSGVLFRRECMNLGVDYSSRSFLSNEHPTSSPTFTCACNNPSRWVVSSDHRQSDLRTLNTSLPQYTILNGNTLQLNLDTVSGEDGGLYECDCGTGYSGLCVLVYARPVFASCPNEIDGCSDETLLTTMAGESVNFNATVVYAPGGNCDFQQEIISISLTKINETFGGSNTSLYNCPTGEGEVCTTGQTLSDRVTLSRGNRPGLNFMFTLSDTIYGNDSGLYKVTIYRVHPESRTETTLTKQFRLQVDQAPPIPTNPSTTTTDEQTSSSDSETTTDQAAANTASNTAGVIAAAVLVPLALIVLVVLGILLLAVRWQQVFCKHRPPEKKEEETPMQSIPQEETDTVEALNGLHDTAKLEVVQRRQLLPLNGAQIPPGNEGEMVVQLPPPNTRISFIENAMHELPEAMELPLTDDAKDKFVVFKQTSLQSDSVVV